MGWGGERQGLCQPLAPVWLSAHFIPTCRDRAGGAFPGPAPRSPLHPPNPTPGGGQQEVVERRGEDLLAAAGDPQRDGKKVSIMAIYRHKPQLPILRTTSEVRQPQVQTQAPPRSLEVAGTSSGFDPGWKGPGLPVGPHHTPGRQKHPGGQGGLAEGPTGRRGQGWARGWARGSRPGCRAASRWARCCGHPGAGAGPGGSRGGGGRAWPGGRCG